jgi:SAM-dependent methyltransferase
LARDLQNLRTDQTTQSSQTNARWSQLAEQIEAIRIAHAAQLAQAAGQGVELTEQVEAIKTAQIAATSKVNACLIEMARNIEMFQSVEPAHPATHVPPVAQVQPVDDPRVTALAETVARIDARMAARPYMGKDTFRALGDLDQPMGYANDPADVAAATEAKPRFSDLFRGPEDFIGQRQRIYLEFLQGRSRIVDIGCGRGEFLRELKGAGLPAVGLEIDPELVSRLREQGLSVNHCDGREYLRHQGDGSLDAIFLAHLLEQFTSEQIVEFVSNVRRVLQPGGVFIAETVNPESFEAMKTFHVDPAHRTPLFPQVMLYLCQSAGFSAARIFYPLGGGFTQRCYQTAGEYAVVAIA